MLKNILIGCFLLISISSCCSPPDKIWNVAYLYHSQEQTADALHRVVRERTALSVAGACPHQWEMLGPNRKGCPICASIADNVCGKWRVVLANGIHIGPNLWCATYPNCGCKVTPDGVTYE